LFNIILVEYVLEVSLSEISDKTELISSREGFFIENDLEMGTLKSNGKEEDLVHIIT